MAIKSFSEFSHLQMPPFLDGLALGEGYVLPPVGHLPTVGALQLEVVPGHR